MRWSQVLAGASRRPCTSSGLSNRVGISSPAVDVAAAEEGAPRLPGAVDAYTRTQGRRRVEAPAQAAEEAPGVVGVQAHLGPVGEQRVGRQQQRVALGLVERGQALERVRVGERQRAAGRCGAAPPGARRSRAPRRCRRPACGCRCPCCSARRAPACRARQLDDRRCAWIVTGARCALDLDAGARVFVQRPALVLERRVHRRHLRRSRRRSARRRLRSARARPRTGRSLQHLAFGVAGASCVTPSFSVAR